MANTTTSRGDPSLDAQQVCRGRPMTRAALLAELVALGWTPDRAVTGINLATFHYLRVEYQDDGAGGLVEVFTAVAVVA